MIDYLSPENINKTNAINDGWLRPEDVKEAVLRLWLDPNDIWARGILTEYLRYRNYKKDGGKTEAPEKETALRSRLMSRIAHAIRRYDRYHEPLLKFLIRDVMSAAGDLDETERRMREEPAARGLPKKVQPPAGGKKDLSSAAAKLGVSPERLSDLLSDLRKNREEDGPAPSIGEMAAKLGVKPAKLESLIFNIPESEGEDDEPWAETPRSLEEIGREYGITSSLMGDVDQANADPDEQDREERPLHTVSLARKRFEDYLIKLSHDKPYGEWVPHASRRRVKIGGQTRIITVEPPPPQMSEEELRETKRKQDDLQNAIISYKKMIKDSAKSEEAGDVKAKKSVDGNGSGNKEGPPLPPPEAFESWYDQNQTRASDLKNKDMYIFLYQEYYLSGNKAGWKALNAAYEKQHNGKKAPVSAQRALYRMKNSLMPEFMEHK